MATLDIQGIQVDCETSSYLTDYKIKVCFVSEDTNEEMVDIMTFHTSAEGRSDLTYDRIEKLINEKFEEKDIQPLEISSIDVKEEHTFKKSVYKDGENYT